MAEPIIICPSCKVEIKLTESLAAPLIESTRREYAQRLARKDADMAAREAALRKREEALSDAEESIELELAARLKGEREKIAVAEAERAKLALAGDLELKLKE